MIRLLDEKLLKEIRELVSNWLYEQKSPEDLVSSFEQYIYGLEVKRTIEQATTTSTHHHCWKAQRIVKRPDRDHSDCERCCICNVRFVDDKK